MKIRTFERRRVDGLVDFETGQRFDGHSKDVVQVPVPQANLAERSEKYLVLGNVERDHADHSFP